MLFLGYHVDSFLCFHSLPIPPHSSLHICPFALFFQSPFAVTLRMEKFSEFLGQPGCLVGLGDPKAAGACSQDVTSPGVSRAPVHYISFFPEILEMQQPEIPPASPAAEGSETGPVNWDLWCRCPRPLPPPSLTWTEGWCVLNACNTSVGQDLPAARTLTHPCCLASLRGIPSTWQPSPGSPR